MYSSTCIVGCGAMDLGYGTLRLSRTCVRPRCQDRACRQFAPVEGGATGRRWSGGPAVDPARRRSHVLPSNITDSRPPIHTPRWACRPPRRRPRRAVGADAATRSWPVPAPMRACHRAPVGPSGRCLGGWSAVAGRAMVAVVVGEGPAFEVCGLEEAVGRFTADRPRTGAQWPLLARGIPTAREH